MFDPTEQTHQEETREDRRCNDDDKNYFIMDTEKTEDLAATCMYLLCFPPKKLQQKKRAVRVCSASALSPPMQTDENPPTQLPRVFPTAEVSGRTVRLPRGEEVRLIQDNMVQPRIQPSGNPASPV